MIIGSKSQTFGNLAVEKLKEQHKCSSGKYSCVSDGVLEAESSFEGSGIVL